MELYSEPVFAKQLDFTGGKPLAQWVEDMRIAAWENSKTLWLVDPFDNDRRWPVVHGYHAVVPRAGGRDRVSSYVCVGNDHSDPKPHRNIYEPTLSRDYGLLRLWKTQQEDRRVMWEQGKAYAAQIGAAIRGGKTF